MQRSLEILVADHDRDVTEGLADILDMAGHKVHRAYTAEKTRELLRLYDFHIAFVNVKIPGLSSMESFAEVRKIKPDAKLIMMSANTIDQLTAQATDGGVVKVMRAPLTIDNVVDALSALGPTGTMLIEDVPVDFGTTLQAVLKERNTSMEIAHDQGEALAGLADSNCDVLLLDLHLTVIRSLEVFLDLRRQGYSLPTIIFQSYADDGPANSQVSGTDIFFKPFDPAQMVKLLEDMAKAEDSGSAPQAPAVPAADEPIVQSYGSSAQGAVAVTVTESDAVLVRKDEEPLQAPPAYPDDSRTDNPLESPLDPAETPEPVESSPAFEAPYPGDTAADPIPLAALEPDPDPVTVQTDADTGVAIAPPFMDELPSHDFVQDFHAETELVPPPATETIAGQEPSVQGNRQAASEEPSPDFDAPVQAEEPVDSLHETGNASILAGERPSEARLPAGVGISADQLERAVNQTGPTGPDIIGGAPVGGRAVPEQDPQETRVLVIDDDHDMAEGLAEVLDDCGLNVKVAHTSESAVATLNDFDAQIALVDIQLGKNSGLDLIANLKQKCPNLIVVMVTAQTDQQSAIIALRNGAFDYLNKPLHPQELLAAMDRCFDELAKRAASASASRTRDVDNGDLQGAASEYMAKLSHKLRTPLNTVVGFSEILSEEMLGPLGSAQYLGYAHDIKEAGKSLISVINNFEDIDKSESGKVEINEEEVDFTRIIFHCLKMIQPAVDAGKLTVEIELAEIPVFMVGDNHKLTQVMLSLLTNAVKFTPSEGKIRFNQRRDEAGGIIVEIIDTGAGIAEEIITEALSSVVEGDGALDPHYEGGGLSLPLATSMAELHGGQLTLDSEMGIGTTATLTLPPERNIAPKRAIAV